MDYENTPHYFCQSEIIYELCNRFGSGLETLDCATKWRLIAVISLWQVEDTDLQTKYGVGVPFSNWLNYNWQNLEISENDILTIVFQIIENAGDDEALALVRSISNQLANRIYV